MTPKLKLPKRERLCSLTAIDALFAASRGRGALVFPLRAVCCRRSAVQPGDPPVRFLISVPKKRLRHAVDRVTMRRRIREAYRLNRCLLGSMEQGGLDVAFIYVADSLQPYARVERAMRALLSRISGNEPAE